MPALVKPGADTMAKRRLKTRTPHARNRELEHEATRWQGNAVRTSDQQSIPLGLGTRCLLVTAHCDVVFCGAGI